MVEVGGEAEPVPILTTEATETHARLSPDGRWMVYASNESGRYEVYIRDFRPDRSPAHGDEKIQVSIDGGNKPVWSADGREVYYLGPSDVLYAVPITTSPRLDAGAADRLFEIRPRGYYPYDVTASGEIIVNSALGGDGPPVPITVILDWQSILSR